MNEDAIAKLEEKISDIALELRAYLRIVSQIRHQELQMEEERKLLNEAKDKHLQAVRKLQADKEEFEMVKKGVEQKRLDIEKRVIVADKKHEELQKEMEAFEIKEKEITQKKLELDEKMKDFKGIEIEREKIAIREREIEREKEIDRQRKQLLDQREKRINDDQQRLSNLLNS